MFWPNNLALDRNRTFRYNPFCRGGLQKTSAQPTAPSGQHKPSLGTCIYKQWSRTGAGRTPHNQYCSNSHRMKTQEHRLAMAAWQLSYRSFSNKAFVFTRKQLLPNRSLHLIAFLDKNLPKKLRDILYTFTQVNMYIRFRVYDVSII